MRHVPGSSTPRRILQLLTAATLLVGLSAACSPRTTTTPRPPAREAAPTPAAANSSDGDTVRVLMLGRSVMRGWFDHWGYDGEKPVERNGYTLEYREIESPPGIADSAVAALADTPAGSIVFFKLCFVDFEAYSSGDVTTRLNENLAYVEQVIAAAADREVILILGNALPRVRGESTSDLSELHRLFNTRLADLAETNEGVYVFDLYGPLSGDGALRTDYAAAPDDSHLNDAAYDMLDEAFFEELDRITGR